MAFFPDVQRGDSFKPDTLLANNVRHIVNTLNGFAASPVTATGGMIRIQVYNASGGTLPAGTAVNFSDGGLCGDAVPAVRLNDPEKTWGVLVNRLEAKAIGGCVICGPVRVTLTGSGDYAAPSAADPEVFSRGSEGAPVICADGGSGIILLGGVARDVYSGPFALSYDAELKQLKVNAGYASMNGEWKEVAGTAISPSAGTVCVCTEPGANGKWTGPEIKVADPGQYAYPVGSCGVSGECVTLCSFRVPVAVFIAADVCSATD